MGNVNNIAYAATCMGLGLLVGTVAFIAGHPRQVWRLLKGIWNDTGRW